MGASPIPHHGLTPSERTATRAVTLETIYENKGNIACERFRQTFTLGKTTLLTMYPEGM
jgi:hypothetical protein